MKKIIALLLVVISLFTLAGCGAKSETGAPAEEKNVTLKLGFQANAGSNEYMAAELLAE